MTEFEREMIAQVGATRLAQRSTIAAVLLAMAEANVLDIERVLAFVDTLASALRHPAGVTSPTSLRTMKLAADEMAELRSAILRITSIPPGAGRA